MMLVPSGNQRAQSEDHTELMMRKIGAAIHDRSGSRREPTRIAR
jgi:hypothetical protein